MLSVITTNAAPLQMLADVTTDETGTSWFRVMSASGPGCPDWKIEPAAIGGRYFGPTGDDSEPALYEIMRVNRKSLTLRRVRSQEIVNVRVIL